MKLYLCEGYDPLFGPIRDSASSGEVARTKAKFFQLHGIPSLNTQFEKNL